MSNIFPRSGKFAPPMVGRGEGAYLFDRQGKAYLDGSSGAAVSCLGHSDIHVQRAVHHQMDTIAFAHTGFMTSEPAEELASRLAELAPGDLSRVYFVSGGSEAMEASLKLARQYFVEIGQPERRRIIARRQSYHGNTLGALAVGGNAWRRKSFEPMLMDVAHVSPCNAYRGQADGEPDGDYVDRLVAEIETEMERAGPETVMAFVAEPVVGATMGAVPSVGDYFPKIRALCDRHGVLLVLDEVMCGMGRTGTLFACERDGVAPDICCVAKGLGAGYQPIGAMLCASRIYDAITGGSGFFQHGHTYMGHATACAAGLAVVERLVDQGVAARVSPVGARLKEFLDDRFGQHPNVGDIRGRGLFWGIELVADRETKTPFDPDLKIHAKVKAAALKAGLICYPMGGTVDGCVGDHILLAPPFILTDGQSDELAGKLAEALDDVLPA